MMIFMFYQVEEFDMGNKLFGTDGVRGVANVYPMTAEFALKLGMAVDLPQNTAGCRCQGYADFR